jgi:hypothetical protein
VCLVELVFEVRAFLFERDGDVTRPVALFSKPRESCRAFGVVVR